MATNKRRDGGASMARAFKAALMCALLAAGGIGYVHKTIDQDRLGRELGERENQLSDLKEEHRRQTAIHSMLTSSDAIRERVRLHHLNLAQATPQQRIFISVPSAVGYPAITGVTPSAVETVKLARLPGALAAVAH